MLQVDFLIFLNIPLRPRFCKFLSSIAAAGRRELKREKSGQRLSPRHRFQSAMKKLFLIFYQNNSWWKPFDKIIEKLRTCYHHSPVCKWVYRWPCVCQRQFRWLWGMTCRQQHREHTSQACMKMTDVKKAPNLLTSVQWQVLHSIFLLLAW